MKYRGIPFTPLKSFLSNPSVFLPLFRFGKVGLYLHGYELPNTVEEVVTFASIYILFLNYMHNSWKISSPWKSALLFMLAKKNWCRCCWKESRRKPSAVILCIRTSSYGGGVGKTNLNSEFKILPPTCFEMHQIKINLKCATNGLCSLYLHQQSAYTRCTLCP